MRTVTDIGLAVGLSAGIEGVFGRDGVTVDSLPSAAPPQLEQWLAFSNRYCGESVQRYGAIASYPTAAQMGV